MSARFRPVSPGRRRGFVVINGASAPLFAAMILAPRSRLTRRLVENAMPLHAALGVSYGVLLTSGMVTMRRPLDFGDPDRLRRALAQQDIFLAGWAHYISFDLFVGQWIWRDALGSGRSSRVALLLTWLAGPVGLTCYVVQKGLSRCPSPS